MGSPHAVLLLVSLSQRCRCCPTRADYLGFGVGSNVDTTDPQWGEVLQLMPCVCSSTGDSAIGLFL